MTQIILNNSIYLPEATQDKYRAYETQLSTQVDMISGRRVLEYRGMVWMIEYEYDYMGNELMWQVNSILRSGSSFNVVFLPDNSNEMISSMFLTDSFPTPSYAFSRAGNPYWHGITFTLREVSPHA